MFGLGCFWGAERLFWQIDGVWVTAVGYAGGLTPNPTYQETCTGLTGHAEVVLVVFDPKIVSYAELLKVFWEAMTRRRACARATTSARPTARRSTPRRGAAAGGDRLARRLRRGAARGRPRQDHDRDRAGAGILLRRGRSSAVSGQEPLRLLRPEGHRRRLRHSGGRPPRSWVRSRRCGRRVAAERFSNRSKFRVNFVFGRARLRIAKGDASGRSAIACRSALPKDAST